MNSKLLVIAAGLALAACNPYLNQQSLAPPGRSARLDEVNGFWGLKHYKLELSQGVALAMTCNQGGPCKRPSVVSENTAIAEVRPASLSSLERVGFTDNAPSTAFVVIGRAPGTTKLHLKTADGKRDVIVTVIAPPAPNAQTQATAAK